MKYPTRRVGFTLGVEAISQDVRYATRTLYRSPGFAVVAIFTIAIGVGTATGMFTIMRGLLLAPPPHVAAPDRVFRLHQVLPARDGADEVFAGTSYQFYELLRKHARSVEAVAGYTSGQLLPVGSGHDAGLARATMVSAGFWNVLGPRPVLGRFIDDQEAHPSTGARVAVLGYAFWQRELGGKENVIGTTLRLKGRQYEVSRPGELHPQALAEPYVNVSAHTAPIIRPPGRRPNRYQWANSLGSRPATPTSQCAARRWCRRRRLYFRMAQRTRRSLK